MCKSIELLRVEEEPIEPMVELVPIYHAKPTFKYGQLKKQLMLKNKEKPDKLQRERCLLDKVNE
jgi:hypothetical protein